MLARVRQAPVLAISIFDSFEVADSHGKWRPLIDMIRNCGVLLWNDDQQLEPTHWLAIDFPGSRLKRILSVPVENRFLICAEPRTVNPLQYNTRVQQMFALIISWESDSDSRSNFGAPPGGSFDPEFRQDALVANDGNRKGCVMLNENKFSLVSRSNYALRNRFARYSWGHGDHLCVAGRNWSKGLGWTAVQQIVHALIALRAHEVPRISKLVRPIPKSCHQYLSGYVDDDISFLSQFKVCVVIENESLYVSEKLFKAFKSGCQCVYVGPQLDPSEFPRGFLYMAEATTSGIRSSVKQALADHYSIDFDSIREWCQSSQFARSNSVDVLNSWAFQHVWTWLQSRSKT
jgi:hypothetical protein